jgi:hypothetical protein
MKTPRWLIVPWTLLFVVNLSLAAARVASGKPKYAIIYALITVFSLTVLIVKVRRNFDRL